jgi:hypothetical protein
MKRNHALVAALVLAAAGCHMCSDCTDYSAPVANSPYAGAGGRAGSVLSGMNGAAISPELAYQPEPTSEYDAASVTQPQAEYQP